MVVVGVVAVAAVVVAMAVAVAVAVAPVARIISSVFMGFQLPCSGSYYAFTHAH